MDAALEINSKGQIVGQYSGQTIGLYGFLREANGTLITLTVPGSIATYAQAISAESQIAGHYVDPSPACPTQGRLARQVRPARSSMPSWLALVRRMNSRTILLIVS